MLSPMTRSKLPSAKIAQADSMTADYEVKNLTTYTCIATSMECREALGLIQRAGMKPSTHGLPGAMGASCLSLSAKDEENCFSFNSPQCEQAFYCREVAGPP